MTTRPRRAGHVNRKAQFYPGHDTHLHLRVYR